MPSSNPNVDPDKCVGHVYPERRVKYNRRDVILYALGVGARESELHLTYEDDPNFAVLPSYASCWAFKGESNDIVPFGSNSQGFPGLTFNPAMILHGEQKIEILAAPLPGEAEFVERSRITHLFDKGKGAVIVIEAVFSEPDTGRPVVKETRSVFVRGLGNFGGERGPSPPKYIPAGRQPDAVVQETVPAHQALLYRLSGDYNPLHADPGLAEMSGFPKPILHGLASYGYATRALIKTFGNNDPSRLQSIAVRFSKPVLPGQTLNVEMWKLDSLKVAFRVTVDGAPIIDNALATFFPTAKL